ncbi:MAG TPA: hypothetical protein VIE89_07265, partial [Candidatus Binatia bacterium]
MVETLAPGSAKYQIMAHGAVALGCVSNRPASAEGPNVSGDKRARSYVVWQGEIYNRDGLLVELGLSGAAPQELSDGEILLRLYQTHGLACAEKINGSFAFALYDNERQEVILGRDRFGIETLYYCDSPKAFIFGSKIASILAYPGVSKALNQNALRRYLVFGYNPGWDTFFRGVQKLRPARLLVLRRDGVTEKKYWSLSFRQTQEKPVSEYCHDILDLTRDAIRLRLNDSERFGIFLSG